LDNILQIGKTMSVKDTKEGSNVETKRGIL